jgi:hypothetical protein
MTKKTTIILLVATLTNFGVSPHSVAAGVTPPAGVKAAFNLLCQNSAAIVAGGTVNKKALKATAVADIGTLATQLGVSQFKAATFLATAAQQIYLDKTALDSCP